MKPDRLTHLYMALSGVTRAIVRSRTRQHLFDGVCQALVHEGPFVVAWIGWYSRELEQLDVVAHCGVNALPFQALTLGHAGSGLRSPTLTAFVEGRPYIASDLPADPTTARFLALIERLGLLSAAVFPIEQEGRPCGTLSVYADTRGFFQEREVRLIGDAATDISFALENLATSEQLAAERSRALRLNRVYLLLSEINKAAARPSTPETFMHEACRIAVEPGGFRMAWIGRWQEDASHHVLPVASAGAVEGYLADLNIDTTDPLRNAGPVGRALLAGEPAVSNDIENDPGMAVWRDAALTRGYRACAAFPIRTGSRVLGTFNLYAAEPGVFDAEEIRLLDELAMDIGFAMEKREAEDRRAEAEASLRASELRVRDTLTRLRTVSRRLHKIKEQERARIAREIHDHFGQALTALKLDLSEVRRRLDKGDRLAIEERLVEMSGLIDQAVDDARRLAAELRPVLLDDLGLVPAMRAYLDDIAHRTGLDCVLSGSTETIDVADDAASALFRIFQEALTNIVRHAAATRVDVQLTVDEACVHLTIRDDGRGLPEAAGWRPGASGLVGMRDRAVFLGGTLMITGGPGAGTTVAASLPVREEEP